MANPSGTLTLSGSSTPSPWTANTGQRFCVMKWKVHFATTIRTGISPPFENNGAVGRCGMHTGGTGAGSNGSTSAYRKH